MPCRILFLFLFLPTFIHSFKFRLWRFLQKIQCLQGIQGSYSLKQIWTACSFSPGHFNFLLYHVVPNFSLIAPNFCVCSVHGNSSPRSIVHQNLHRPIFFLTVLLVLIMLICTELAYESRLLVSKYFVLTAVLLAWVP